MPTTAIDTYIRLADETSSRLTRSHTEWTGFLKTAARLYKYPYHEQMMIYAQRPDATACAEYDIWNNRMRRYVRRGSKGIALLDTAGNTPKLRYVFDVKDTGTRQQSRDVWQWSLDEENLAVAQTALENGYDIAATEGLERQLHTVSSLLSQMYWIDHQREILDIVDGSFLQD